MRNKTKLYQYIFRTAFISFCLIATLISITQSFSKVSAAESSSSATASATVSSACSFSRTSGNGEYNGTLSNGATTSIPGSTFTTSCNDPGGYAIYAVGYSNNTFGNTDLIFNNTPNSTNNIKTDGDTIVGGNGSNWGMSLSASVSGKPSIESGFSDPDNPHTIPSTYTKIASYNTTTAGINPDTNQEELLGQSVTVTYSATASNTQPAGTYTGAVKYTMVHPSSVVATKTIEDMHYMQDFAGLTNSDKAGILASMPTGVQYQLIDNRDDKSYYISKLADNNIWMTQNLDLCIGCDNVATLTSENTDLNEYGVNGYTTQYGYTKDSNNIITWTPVSTAITSSHTIDSDELVNDWVDSASIPYSVEGGDFYYYTNNLDQNMYATDLVYDSITACTEAGHTEADCIHYHIGNYYNQTAAIASNNSRQLTTQYSVVANSICPAGWRLPKGAASAEYSAATHESNQLFYASGITVSLDSNQYAADGFLNIRKAPLYFVRGGTIYDGKRALRAYGYYNSSTIQSSVYLKGMQFYRNEALGGTQLHRAWGRLVRCLAR